MNLGEHQENVLEAILMAEELGENTFHGIEGARSEDVHVEVSRQDIDFFIEHEFVSIDGEKIVLTGEGRKVAERTLRRHRLAEMLLYSLLGVDRSLASEIGCMVEHGIREEMLDGVCTLLGHPSNCPHGRPIPKGRCCESRTKVVESQVVPLTSLEPGDRARIVYLQPKSHERLHKLASLGLNPGVELLLHRRKPAFCLRYEGTELAMDASFADDIQVCRIPGGGEN
jgi:DtxR family Mn-dependent transcriptional regulator